jgi:hypothetical protein
MPFDYSFGGVEIENMENIIESIADEYENVRPIKTLEEMVDWLRSFPQEFAEPLHNRVDVLDMIPE